MSTKPYSESVSVSCCSQPALPTSTTQPYSSVYHVNQTAGPSSFQHGWGSDPRNQQLRPSASVFHPSQQPLSLHDAQPFNAFPYVPHGSTLPSICHSFPQTSFPTSLPQSSSPTSQFPQYYCAPPLVQLTQTTFPSSL